MRYGVITYAPIVQPTMSFNRNISNNFFAAVSVDSEFELREILDAEGRKMTIDAAKSYTMNKENPRY